MKKTMQRINMAQMRAMHVQEKMQERNVNKHLRIARATTGHEQSVHIAKAKKFAERYGMKIAV